MRNAVEIITDLQPLHLLSIEKIIIMIKQIKEQERELIRSTCSVEDENDDRGLEGRKGKRSELSCVGVCRTGNSGELAISE